MLFSTMLTLWAQAQDAAQSVAPEVAQGTAPAAGQTGSNPLSFMMVVFMGLLAMYLLFILPKQSQAKQAKKMLDSLNKNDRVMTTSGIIGIIHSIDKEAGEVVLKVDESNNTKIRFSTGAIYYVFSDKTKEKEKEGEKK